MVDCCEDALRQRRIRLGNVDAGTGAFAEGRLRRPPRKHQVRTHVERLQLQRLQCEETKAEAASIPRSLVDQITLQPDGEGLAIVLRGDLAAMLSFAANTKKPGLRGETGLLCDPASQASLVAGAVFGLYRTDDKAPS